MATNKHEEMPTGDKPGDAMAVLAVMGILVAFTLLLVGLLVVAAI